MESNSQKGSLNIKKSLLITLDFPPQQGGVANYLSNLSNNIASNNIIVLANNDKQSDSFDSQQKYKIIRKKLYYKNFWPKWLKIYFICKKIIRDKNIEQLIISHVLPMGYICLLLNKPYFLILHGYDVLAAQNNIWKKFWLKIILKKAKHIIVNSRFTKDQALKLSINENKITIVYPCPSINTQLSATKKQLLHDELKLKDKQVILSVGRLVKRKGIDKVIESLPDVIKKSPNLIYIIIGQGKYKIELEKLAKKFNVSSHVIFLNNISDHNLPYFYDIADIFIMPSRMENNTDVEGFGIVYLEANLFAKPVIGGNSGGVKDAIIDKQTGILVEPKNVSSIGNAILQLLTNNELANKYGIQGKQRVLQEFQWPTQINKLKNIL